MSMRSIINITKNLFESPSGVENDLLSPFNQSKMIGNETKIFDYGDVQAYQSTYTHASNRSIRYVKINDDGEIICVLQFRTKGPRSKKGIIQNVYTRSDSRRKGYALELLKKARWDFDVKHSKDLTTDGKAWKSGIGEGITQSNLIDLSELTQIILEGKSHPVICVDVQPSYSGIHDGDENPIFEEIIKFVNNQSGPVLMFVNAEKDGLTTDAVQDIKQYWHDTIIGDIDQYYNEELDDYDIPENVINWSRFQIVDKGYGYLRSWMDHGISDKAIIKTIREMYKHNVSDSRQLNDINENYIQNILEWEYDDFVDTESISVFWTSISQLKDFNGAYIVGGGRNECLREIELLMNAFNIKYKRIDSLVYG